jgi:hypothetical protein
VGWGVRFIECELGHGSEPGEGERGLVFGRDLVVVGDVVGGEV